MTAFDFFAVIYYFFLALSGRSIHGPIDLHLVGIYKFFNDLKYEPDRFDFFDTNLLNLTVLFVLKKS